MAENKIPNSLSRREFLRDAAVVSGGIVLVGFAPGPEPTGQPMVVPPTAPQAQTGTRTVYVPNAKMVLVHFSNRCVGCRRCEIACNLSHDTTVQPTITRIKVQRNRQFGPQGARVGTSGQGLFGDFRVIADTCLQCPHPVPCMDACPVGAIEIDPKTNARVVNAAKCTGCMTCLKACPWAMTSFDAVTKKATKCDLCGGDPQCVKWCPSGALTVTAWRDRTKDTPIRQVVTANIGIPADVSSTCVQCHPNK